MTVPTPARPAPGGQPAPRPMHLAVHVPAADDPVVRADLRTGLPAGLPADFASYARLARTAERGLFDFLLLSEELRLREDGGSGHGADAAGRPEPVTALNALAAVTGRLGLAASVGTRFIEPYELARGFATLDHLSGGRAAWHVAHAADPLAGENFRDDVSPDRSGPSAAPFARTAEFVAAAREVWDSWTPDGVSRPFAHRGRYFDIAGESTVARSPQGHPVVIRSLDATVDTAPDAAQDTAEDREFAAAVADVVLVPHRTPAAGRVLHADVKGRLAGYGRDHDDLKVLSRATFVLGDTIAEARERAAGAADPWSFVGTPESVAAGMDDFVRSGAADGFLLAPHPGPGGLDEFVDRVVPLLQERGAFRTRYTGATLRARLGLPHPVWKG
ncbi:LLM class flavin-dependent oxidoreductase [Streptomyces apricus]|nr:LLM class flavin-dependent oxidoreductase [Streptomyces apricus]